MILLRILLFPFSWLYYLVTDIRNRMYDRRLKPSVSFEIPVISVGNLSVGGTGKTPMIEYLIRLLDRQYNVATLSRGYGRKTTGFRIANPTDNAKSLGDEPFQLYQKFGNDITVSVGEERALAIPLILQEHEETQVILLDDAFQHREVVPQFSILLTDYHKPFFNDHLLPAGRLRESRWSAQRADIIVVTKCPSEISADEMMDIEKAIRAYAVKPVFFSTIRYGAATVFSNCNNNIQIQKVALVTAIASPSLVKDYVSHHYALLKHFDYRDHHYYNANDIKDWKQFAKTNPDVIFLTTEKDRVKLESPDFQAAISPLCFYYLPIEIEFIKAGKDFDEMVLNVAKGV
jgi:tetraacyldisaccharide 4'-kinase